MGTYPGFSGREWVLADINDMLRDIELTVTATRNEIGRDQLASKVMAAMKKGRRDLFVPREQKEFAYHDNPLPIGYKQTISQPYIVGLMTSLLQLKGHEKVLEIGTGSGYQAAVLSPICADVFSIEIVKELAERSSQTLIQLGYDNIHVKWGDGYQGWPDEAPFDAVIVTAAPPEVPPKLFEQLKVGGRLVIPVGSIWQELWVITKLQGGIMDKESVIPVRFVPMVHPAKPIPK